MWSREKLLHPATLIACAALFVSLGGVGYAAATIGTRDIQNGAVTARKLHRRAVTGSRIANAAVGNAKLANGAVSEGKLAAGAVTSGKLAERSVTTGKLADAAVTSGKLADAAVTSGKLADAAVTTGKLADASVTGAKLAAGTAVGGVGELRQTTLTLRNGNAGVILMDVPFLGRLEGTCAAGIGSTGFHNLSGTSILVQATGVDNGAPDRAFTDRNNPADGLTVLQPNGGNGPQEVDWQASLGQGASAHVATLFTTSGANGTDCIFTVQALMT